MEKPVRIVTSEKIRAFNEKVRNGLEHALNFMMSAEASAPIVLGGFEPFLMPIDTYIHAFKKKSVLIKVLSEKSIVGELYWFFEIQSAVALGGTLRMLAPMVIAEKVAKSNFDLGDKDAFGEVANQLCGILDRAFRSLTTRDVHLRMDFSQRIFPDEQIRVENFINQEEYVVLLTDLTIPVVGRQKITLLIPRSHYELLLNVELQLDGITPRVLLVHSHDPERVVKLQAQLNSRQVKVVLLERADDLLEKFNMPGIAGIALDLPRMQFPMPHNVSMLFKRIAANWALMKIPMFICWANPSEEGVKEIEKLGIKATRKKLLDEFPTWAQVNAKEAIPQAEE